MNFSSFYRDEQENFNPLLLVGIFFLFLGFIFWKSEKEAAIPFLIICFIFCCLIQIKDVIIYNKHKKIKNNGIKISGTICDLKYTTRKSRGISVIYRLIVKYIDPNTKEEKMFLTPYLNFNPLDELGSFNCNVYIHNGDIYVGDFQKQPKGQTSIWSEEYISKFNPKRLADIGLLTHFAQMIITTFIVVGIVVIVVQFIK